MNGKIEVKAKITAGTHPKHGAIIEGQTYFIDEKDFAPQLFKRVEKSTETETPAEAPAEAKKKKRR